MKTHNVSRSASSSHPGITVSARGAGRIHAGHPWVYRSDVVSATGVAPGAIAVVRDPSGNVLGTALYSDASEIAVRLLSSQELKAADFPELLRRRIKTAIDYRQRVAAATDAYRVVFSEADLLPGLIVDRFADVLSVQFLSQAMDSPQARSVVLEELTSRFAPAGIVERVDARVRELERLPERSPGLLAGDKAETVFTMNGVRFQYAGLSGQKTGAFLDQRENYAAAARYARGQALDVCCYQGGFALHLAAVCEQVSGVDSSRAALEVAEQNAALNGRDLEWIEGNAFDLLKDYAAAGRQFDTVVLDPPAFAKTKKALPAALRGYKETNLRALKMLRPGDCW